MAQPQSEHPPVLPELVDDERAEVLRAQNEQNRRASETARAADRSKSPGFALPGPGEDRAAMVRREVHDHDKRWDNGPGLLSLRVPGGGVVRGLMYRGSPGSTAAEGLARAPGEPGRGGVVLPEQWREETIRLQGTQRGRPLALGTEVPQQVPPDPARVSRRYELARRDPTGLACAGVPGMDPAVRSNGGPRNDNSRAQSSA